MLRKVNMMNFNTNIQKKNKIYRLHRILKTSKGSKFPHSMKNETTPRVESKRFCDRSNRHEQCLKIELSCDPILPLQYQTTYPEHPNHSVE
jgi:hypothetical protein